MEYIIRRNDDDELMHYGIPGMKWGVRKQHQGVSENTKKNSPSKKANRHIGINDNGNISFITEKTSSKAKKNFAIKSSLVIGSMAVAGYIMKHPDVIDKGKRTVSSFLRKNGTKNITNNSGIFSKSLGRMLTISEAIELGFDVFN